MLKAAWQRLPHRLRRAASRLTPEPIRQMATRSWQVPVNRRNRDPRNIAGEAKHAIRVADMYDELAQRYGLSVPGLRVLEIGPGTHFGPQLLLADRGAQVTLVDRFVAPWDAGYHPYLYRELRKLTGPSRTLDAVIAAQGYPPEYLTIINQPAEAMTAVPTGSIDLVLSWAVLEHVYDLAAVCRSIARVTRAGGIGSHQVDFRDHLHMDQPLEFLLSSPLRANIDFSYRRGERGNRRRPSELVTLLKRVGFDRVDINVTEEVGAAYLTDFLPRLRATRTSPYRSWPMEDLRILGAKITAWR
jgi:SAM-dependent methyltransferase